MPSSPRIVVVGSANVDLTTFTDAFPRPGETIFGREFHLGFGGKGANQAVAARLCGAEVSMVARVGDDLFGPATIRNFEARGIDASRVLITAGVSSGVAPIFVDSAGENRILVVKGANDKLSPADIEGSGDLLRRADFIILQLEIPLETVYYTLEFARKHGVRTILNPAPAQPLDREQAGKADYLIPNETEAREVGPRSSWAADCRFIITVGANGAVLVAADGAERHVPAFPVTPIDTSGAGDAFIGSLACFLASGMDELQAIARSNLYAALSTLARGTQSSFVSRERFEREWQARTPATG
ncbi:MAG: ribokinase [Bryobacterales bacterium]|nr:ribokinase [Bryobacterales bacterium]